MVLHPVDHATECYHTLHILYVPLNC